MSITGDDGGGSSSGSSGGTGTTSGGMSSGFATSSSGGATDAGGHGMRCDDAGNCSCIAIASIGHEGVWGPCSGDTTTAFQGWLNSQSTAHVDSYDTTKPTITADFLSQYDVIILQWMVANGQKNNDGAAWVFSSDEITALQTWVNNGGGVIALDGYQGTDPSMVFDITATNQLLSWTDMQFNKDVQLGNATGDDYCWGGAVPLGGPVSSAPAGTQAATAQAMTPSFGTWSQATGSIGLHVNSLGVLDTRSINITNPSNVAVDIQWTDATGTHVGAAHESIGKGHVVFYGDEWITYTGEWTGSSTCQTEAFDSGYDPCFMSSADKVFQIPQFWYNAIKYAGSAVQCTFKINSPGVVL
jgi:hypothetical protein